jgi:hypothetical protein
MNNLPLNLLASACIVKCANDEKRQTDANKRMILGTYRAEAGLW